MKSQLTEGLWCCFLKGGWSCGSHSKECSGDAQKASCQTIVFFRERLNEESSSVASILDLHGQRPGLNPQYLVNKSTTTTKIPHYVSTGFELYPSTSNFHLWLNTGWGFANVSYPAYTTNTCRENHGQRPTVEFSGSLPSPVLSLMVASYSLTCIVRRDAGALQ